MSGLKTVVQQEHHQAGAISINGGNTGVNVNLNKVQFINNSAINGGAVFIKSDSKTIPT